MYFALSELSLTYVFVQPTSDGQRGASGTASLRGLSQAGSCLQVFLSARSWSLEDTSQGKPFGDHSNIYRVPGFERMDAEGNVHFSGGRSVPCIDTVRTS